MRTYYTLDKSTKKHYLSRSQNKDQSCTKAATFKKLHPASFFPPLTVSSSSLRALGK
jgi:hypothetical protein